MAMIVMAVHGLLKMKKKWNKVVKKKGNNVDSSIPIFVAERNGKGEDFSLTLPSLSLSPFTFLICVDPVDDFIQDRQEKGIICNAIPV